MIKIFLFILLLSLPACGNGNSNSNSSSKSVPTGPTRAFRMALTPFAQDTSAASRDQAWRFVKQHGDMVALHLDDLSGLPWEDLYNGVVPPSFRTQFDDISGLLQASDVVYVAITPLNRERSGVTGNYGGGAFPQALGAADFTNPKLRKAFVEYARFVAETLKPTYMAIGIEVNLYSLAKPEDFANLVALYKEVYRDLKALSPSLVIFPTVQIEFMHGYNQWSLLQQFEPEIDRVGISLYPSSQGFLPADIPVDWISMAASQTGKRVVIAETGYGTQPFSGSFNAPGSDGLQLQYLQWLLNQADQLRPDFIVWFFPSDLPVSLQSAIPNALFYYSMGLAKLDFTAKPSLAKWDKYLLRPYAP